MALKKLGILIGGGPAPGANGVIAAVALEAIKHGITPIGFHDGFEWLSQRYTDEQHELTVEEVSRIHLAGGVILALRAPISRAICRALQNTIAALEKLGIEALVAVGGDDLLASSIAIEEQYARRNHASSRFRRVSTTIFGCRCRWRRSAIETARHVGVKIVENLMEDAQDDRALVHRRDDGAADRTSDARDRKGGDGDLHRHP